MTTKPELVLDAPCSTAADIITFEEVVREMHDENDRDMIARCRGAAGGMTLPGTFPVHDLADLKVVGVPEGPYSTLAGLVLQRLGRIPDRPGDQVEVAGWRFTVTAIARHAITEIRIHKLPGRPAGSTTARERSERRDGRNV